MVLIFVASSAASYELPHFGAWDTGVKKIGHLTGYAILGVAYFYALTSDKRGDRRAFLLALSLSVLYSISDELHQKFTPGRNPSAIDVLVDTAGALIGLSLSVPIRERFRGCHALRQLEGKR